MPPSARHRPSNQVLVRERGRNALTDDGRARWRAATLDGGRVWSLTWARSRVDTRSASGCNHSAASAASWKVRMRNRPTRRSWRASGTLSLTRTAARVPDSCASWARKKFTMQPRKLLVGRAARRRSMKIRRSRDRAGALRRSSIASSNSVNVYGSMSSNSALGRPGYTNHVTAMRKPPSMTVRGSRRSSVAHLQRKSSAARQGAESVHRIRQTRTHYSLRSRGLDPSELVRLSQVSWVKTAPRQRGRNQARDLARRGLDGLRRSLASYRAPGRDDPDCPSASLVCHSPDGVPFPDGPWRTAVRRSQVRHY